MAVVAAAMASHLRMLIWQEVQGKTHTQVAFTESHSALGPSKSILFTLLQAAGTPPH